MNDFNYLDERFADIQMLHYRLRGFEDLTLKQKLYAYYLSEATLCGRDITFDQFGCYNLRIRQTLEAVYLHYDCDRTTAEFHALETYLRQLWFASGIHHHYAQDKFQPAFSVNFITEAILSVPLHTLPLREGETRLELINELMPVLFSPDIQPKRVCIDAGVDQVQSSACNYYQGVTQHEAEAFYEAQRETVPGEEKPSFGLNSTLVKEDGALKEIVWSENGRYGEAIKRITYWLEKAAEVAENDQQRRVIALIVKYYRSGDLRVFDDYSIEWLKEQEGQIDFINGFIEVYGDPLGIKASWEAIVEYKDLEATRRTQLICQNAQWFEDHSPVDPRFRKPQVKGVTANVVCAAMLGGDEYPASAIGINLPNADWIRARHGSKSVTIGNLTEAYSKASKGSGFREEFISDSAVLDLIERYADACDDLHTDLHECLGHGSGQLLPGVDAGALRSYGSTIEEARADLFGLYYIADEKLVELGLLPDMEAYKSQYYSYMLNGLMTQMVRIKRGQQIEEAHMRNRALIARWAMAHGSDIIKLEKQDGKTYLTITDYPRLRQLFAELLAEVQRIKSEGDYEAAARLVEDYGVRIDKQLHDEVLQRYDQLHLAPYKGFVNPVLRIEKGDDGTITDVSIDYSEGYTQQMLRYSRDYAFLSIASK